MVTLAKGRENVVLLKVNSTEPLNGFTASLFACGISRTLAKLERGFNKFVISAEESSSVAEAPRSDVGTLVVSGPEGELRAKAVLSFTLVDVGDGEVPTTERQVFIHLPGRLTTPSSGGGGEGSAVDLSKYATKTELNKAGEECKTYVDEKVADIGETIIADQKITVVNSEGATTEITLKEAAQSVVEMQKKVELVASKSFSVSVKDEDKDGQPDDGVLYFDPCIDL